MSAYYNECDKFAAAELRELIAASVIAPGDVDERSIEDVRADEIKGYTQCHFFAGIGVWSYALRQAGWADSRPVWTGSCPCPPFSTAGKKKACPSCGGTKPVPHVGRTGYFVCCLCDHEWLADGRHLWPEMWRLIRDRRPVCLYGEQVGGNDGETWLTLVRASLEILGYEVWPAGLTASGFGAPHIRQRLYFVAQSLRAAGERRAGSVLGEKAAVSGTRRANGNRADGFEHGGETDPLADTIGGGRNGRTSEPRREAEERNAAAGRSEAGGMAHAERARFGGRRPGQAGGEPGPLERPERLRATGELGDAGGTRLEGHAGDERDRHEPGRLGAHAAGHAAATGGAGELGDAERAGHDGPQGESPQPCRNGPEGRLSDGAGFTNGFWADAEWLPCRDGKWRAVEPAPLGLADGLAADLGRVRLPSGREVFFPLITKGKARVGRLRGAGNALCAPAAIAFIRAAKEVLKHGH